MIAEYADCIVDKYVYSCVDKSFLQRLCQINDGDYPERVFITGVDTDCCVLATAVSLYESNVRPIVLTQFVYSNGGEEQQVVEKLLKDTLYGYVTSMNAFDLLKSHDLSSLLSEIKKEFPDCPLTIDDMQFLTSFYYDGEYPIAGYVFAEKEDAVKGFRIVNDTMRWASHLRENKQ